MKKRIKLRDLTAEQYKEWYSNNQCEDKNCNECPLNPVLCHTNDKDCWVYCKDLFSNKFLDQEIDIEVPDILTKEEKKYLSNVINPFRDRVINIAKTYNENLRGLAINIAFNDCDIPNVIIPLFKNKDGEYAFDGMTTFLSYTLEELGL